MGKKNERDKKTSNGRVHTESILYQRQDKYNEDATEVISSAVHNIISELGEDVEREGC